MGLNFVNIGTPAWEINFVYFLVSRTTCYALSGGSHKKNQKVLRFEVQNFVFFELFQLYP